MTVSGVLHQGTPGQVVYQAIKPADWNGTLILDLDFNGWNQARRDYFLNRGYAIGGNQRTQNETAYELKDYVDNLVTTKDLLMDAIEQATGEEEVEPTRTIAWGNSRGGFVARMAAQYRPDAFDGALGGAGGGSGVIASWLSKVDAVWALQQLVNPDAGLTINNLPDIAPGATYGSNYDQDRKLAALVTEARANDQGMARLILAAAFEQATDFPSGSQPPAADDYLTQGNLIASGFAFGNPQFVHKEVEVMGGGPIAWNHGIDYRQLLEDSGAKARVEWWYDRAGLDLEADLALLDAAPRIGADPAAVETVEDIGTYDGTGAPVITIKTLGDSADPAPLDEAYVRTFKAAGTADANLRALLIERPGHGGQSFGEMLAAFEVLEERLDTGVWPDVSPAAMNARVAELAVTTGLPLATFGGGGTGKYIPFDAIPPALRTWDFTNWGTYAPELSADIEAGSFVEGTSDVVFTAVDANATAYDAELLRSNGTAVPGVSAHVDAPQDHILTLAGVDWDALPDDTYTLRFVASYRNGMTFPLEVDVIRDTTAPSGEISVASHVYTSTPGAVTVDTSDRNGVQSVSAVVLDRPGKSVVADLGAASSADGSTWTVPIAKGLSVKVYLLRVTVVDNAGNESVVETTFNVLPDAAGKNGKNK